MVWGMADESRTRSRRPVSDPVSHSYFTEWYDKKMSGTYTVTMGDRGRLVIPSELRQRSGLEEGSPLVLLETPGGLVLLTRSQLQERVRADLAGLDLVGELLAERRAEAAADDAA